MLKKLQLTLIIVLIVVSYSFSQTYVGFTSGLNIASLSGDNAKFDKKISRKGLYEGILFDIRIAYQTYMQVGGFYSQQGIQYKSVFFDYGKKVSYSVKNNLDYIFVPITWKQMWGEVYTKIGGYGEVAFMGKSKWKRLEEFADTAITTNGTYNSFTNELRRYDIGILFAVGIQIPISDQFDVYFEASYKLGFFPIDNVAYRPEEVMRNRFFTLNVGVILFGKKSRYATRLLN